VGGKEADTRGGAGGLQALAGGGAKSGGGGVGGGLSSGSFEALMKLKAKLEASEAYDSKP